MTNLYINGPDNTRVSIFPDIGLSGAVLDPEALGLAYEHNEHGKSSDRILFGIAVRDGGNVVQFDMENAVRLRDKLSEIIEANT